MGILIDTYGKSKAVSPRNINFSVDELDNLVGENFTATQLITKEYLISSILDSEAINFKVNQLYGIKARGNCLIANIDEVGK